MSKSSNSSKSNSSKSNSSKYKIIKHRDHVLNHSDTYMGSKEVHKEKMYIKSDDENSIIEKEIEYIPALKDTTTKWTVSENRSVETIMADILEAFDGYFIKIVDNKTIYHAITIKEYSVVLTLPSTSPTIEPNFVNGRIISDLAYKNLKIINSTDFFNNYNTYYTIINSIDNENIITKPVNELNIINKCDDLISNNICIPKDKKIIMSNNINIGEVSTNDDFLITKYEMFKNPNNTFRIINQYGKYLCDLYVNNTHYCSDIDLSTIMFQEQFNSIDIIKTKVHNMHSFSYESLWSMKYNEKNKSFEIYNLYTNKSLKENTEFYIEFIENKYFRQNTICTTTSNIVYNNEDLYIIYYIDSNSKKIYLTYNDIFVNNKYNKSAKIVFNETSTTPFIIKLANYNLDTITYKHPGLPNKITNISYSKDRSCDTPKNIDLISNNKIKNLNIKYILSEIDGDLVNEIENTYNINKIDKNNDNFLDINGNYTYKLEIIVNNSTLNSIEYLINNINADITIKNINIYKNKNIIHSVDEIIITRSAQKKITPNNIDFNNPIENVNKIEFLMVSNYNFTINYIKIMGIPDKYNYMIENTITNSTIYSSVDTELQKINKSLISKKLI